MTDGPTDPVAKAALFDLAPDGCFLPTPAASGAWTEGVLHGGAVAALLAGLLEHDEQVMSRVLVELLGPVPTRPLRAEISRTEGGRRVMRQQATLFDGDRPVARASALRMRRTELELPAPATNHPLVFDPARVPDLSQPNRHAARAVGHDCFDGLAVGYRPEPREPGAPDPVRLWARLLVSVVAGRPTSPVEQAVAAADLASSAVSARLDFRSWSFMNADLVVSFARPPVGDWVGLECVGLLAPTGTGQSASTIHDANGPFARSSQSVIIERR